MEEPIDNETALREDIVLLREKAAQLRRQLGALENEVRKREGEFIAIRAAAWVDDGE